MGRVDVRPQPDGPLLVLEYLDDREAPEGGVVPLWRVGEQAVLRREPPARGLPELTGSTFEAAK